MLSLNLSSSAVYSSGCGHEYYFLKFTDCVNKGKQTMVCFVHLNLKYKSNLKIDATIMYLLNSIK